MRICARSLSRWSRTITSPTQGLLAFTTTIVPGKMAGKMAGKLNLDTRIRLKSGYEIPALGFGVYQTPAAEAESIVSKAVEAGYCHVDSAAVYRNESPSSAGLLSSKSIPRDQLFFTSKVPPKEISYEGAKNCVDETLRQTGLDYVDLYLLHAPYGGKEGRLGAWKALVEARQAGKVRSTGVSNFGVRHLEELWKEGEKSAEYLDVNQVELHPWLPRDDIVGWCQERGIVLEAYSPLVRGQRSEDPTLQSLAKKHTKSPAQILIRWSLQKGFVPLPKTVTPSRVTENANVYDFELDDEDMKKLKFDSYEPCAWDPTTLED